MYEVQGKYNLEVSLKIFLTSIDQNHRLFAVDFWDILNIKFWKNKDP